MRAILLAAGKGKRLRPYTLHTPKCLMKINDIPLLYIWLTRLSDVGINNFLINTHYLSDKVNDFILKSKFAKNVFLKHEVKLLGTAATLINNKKFFNNSDCLIVHADNYCLADFDEFILAHNNRPPECIMTMMLFKTPDPTNCGIVELDQRGVVTSFHEKVKSPPSNIANAAIYILSSDFFEKIPFRLHLSKDFSKDILPNLLGKIYTYETNKTMIDIGNKKNYNLAQSK